eukprot:gnl/TRDRNA2_/TRDRNA2_157492_c1_seq6.p1 gnl/TRDRNA2_/TRDRNA2_157492_c1~~gnl/TRDRNA2_/TRDRNA2_157492_c1_seq6.p1  ORF type:complete len:150 (+),score=16.51 gnl/TRDRNA2_/TRDRNA2_157492_c1_seq6:61-450(+)
MVSAGRTCGPLLAPGKNVHRACRGMDIEDPTRNLLEAATFMMSLWEWGVGSSSDVGAPGETEVFDTSMACFLAKTGGLHESLILRRHACPPSHHEDEVSSDDDTPHESPKAVCWKESTHGTVPSADVVV